MQAFLALLLQLFGLTLGARLHVLHILRVLEVKVGTTCACETEDGKEKGVV